MKPMGAVIPTSAAPHATEVLPQPGREEIQLAAVLHALSDPMRLQIVVGPGSG